MAFLLNKSDMASSIGISVQAFDKWGVPLVERRGREVFYDVKTVLEIDRERRQHNQRITGNCQVRANTGNYIIITSA